MDGNGWEISCVDFILQESRNLQNLRNKIIVKINSVEIIFTIFLFSNISSTPWHAT